MKAMLQAKLQTAALIAGACLVAAGGGTLLAQQVAKPKPAEKPLVSVAGTFDRTTPIGALRDFADALERSDSNRVFRAMNTTTPAMRNIALPMAEAVEAEREFKRVVAARFGKQPVKVININFGQASLYDEEAVQSAVQFTDADRAIVTLPSRSEPDKPHKVNLVRVGGVWKLPDTDAADIDDDPAQIEMVFRKSVAQMYEIGGEIEAGQYRSYNEAVRALVKRVMNSR